MVLIDSVIVNESDSLMSDFKTIFSITSQDQVFESESRLSPNTSENMVIDVFVFLRCL